MDSAVATMDLDGIASLARDGARLAVLISAPILLTGAIVGLLTGLLQAAAQIQDQTFAFVVKISAMILALALFLPWILARLVDFSRQLFENASTTAILFSQ